MKIVVNACFGGFDLSEEAEALFLQKSGVEFDSWEIERDNQYLIEVVEELKEKANSGFSDLRIVEIPKEATDWRIDEYDGSESVIAVVDGKIKDLF